MGKLKMTNAFFEQPLPKLHILSEYLDMEDNK